MRRLAGTRKVGHAGTLDPMATGVLVLGIGRATRLLTYIVGHDKEYLATIRLGETTVTDDAEGEITASVDASAVTDAQIADAVAELTGEIQQVPSSVSAIKVDGVRSYKRARDGEDVQLKARPVTVAEFVVLETRRSDAHVDLDVRVTVSSGTYVRALARDLGRLLEVGGQPVGGHLTALRRTRVGGLTLNEARTLEDLSDVVDGGAQVPLISLAGAASAVLPVTTVTQAHVVALGYGQTIELAATQLPADVGEGPVAALSSDGELVAIIDHKRGAWRPAVVFQPAGVVTT